MAAPNLGYGKASAQSLDSVNQWMRSQPWYQAFLQQNGISPSAVKLSNAQKAALVKAAQANGLVVDEGKQELDDSGNFRNKSHKLRNTLIAAGIGAGAAFGVPALVGAMGAGSAGAGAGAAAAGSGAGTAAAAAPALGVGLGETAAVTGLAGSPFLAPLASTAIGSGVAAPIAGGTGAALSAKGGGTLATIGRFLKGDNVGDVLSAAGKGIGAAATAAGQNRLDQEQLALQANGQNIQGQSAFERELMERALLEDRQRKDSLKDVARASFFGNQPRSPYNPAGTPALSPEYRAAMDALAARGKETLAKSPMYAAGSLPGLKPYQPLDIKNLQGATGTRPSTLESIGKWVGPSMTVAGQYFGA